MLPVASSLCPPVSFFNPPSRLTLDSFPSLPLSVGPSGCSHVRLFLLSTFMSFWCIRMGSRLQQPFSAGSGSILPPSPSLTLSQLLPPCFLSSYSTCRLPFRLDTVKSPHTVCHHIDSTGLAVKASRESKFLQGDELMLVIF